ncbi:hypothetical protein BC629DRAFT_1587162 [Irpex lacteus]|nr:hypothetical protein BC629DRAFT_1587162 [Irpex lacteus]
MSTPPATRRSAAKRTEAPPSEPAAESPTKKAKHSALPVSTGDSDDSATENDTLSSAEDPPPSSPPDLAGDRTTALPNPPTTAPADNGNEVTATVGAVQNARYKYNDCGYIPVDFIKSRMDTGGRKVKNELGYYRPPELLKAGIDLNWKGRFLQVGQNQLVVSVMVRNMASVFKLKSREDIDSTDEDPAPGSDIPSRQFLRFHPLRDIDREGLDYVLHGQQNPKTRPKRRSYYAGHWTRVKKQDTKGKGAETPKKDGDEDGDTVIVPFDKVKDSALTVNWGTNPVLDPAELRPNDILFLEVIVRRWPTKKGGYNGGWSTAFDLWRIFRMLKAPDGVEIEPDSGDERRTIVLDDD